jgi:hypothetical protein
MKNYHSTLNFFKFVVLVISVSLNSQIAYAQANCIKVDQIEKWEVLDTTKTIIFDKQGNSIAFVVFQDWSNLKKNGETFRFFSSTICKYDRVQTSSGMSTITSIEPIRR